MERIQICTEGQTDRHLYTDSYIRLNFVCEGVGVYKSNVHTYSNIEDSTQPKHCNGTDVAGGFQNKTPKKN